MTVINLDSERRLRKQFQSLSSPQDFVQMIQDAKAKLERADRERLLLNGYARRHPNTDGDAA